MEDFDLDITNEEVATVVETPKQKQTKTKRKSIASNNENKELINPLKKERVIVRYIPRQTGIWGNNPKHVLAGGMSENAIKTFVVPKLSSGIYTNILTDNEKAFLEDVLGLEPNALSVYKKQDNFWSDINPDGINTVKLKKQDNYLDLSSPEDYIRYKILLANKNFIAPSLEELQDRPKATYQFVIINEDNQNKVARNKMTYTMECYKEFGKIEDNKDKLKVIIETLTTRPLAANTKLDFLQTKCNELIQNDSKRFLSVIKDEYLDNKVLIKQSVELGNVIKRGNFYYLRNANETIPLCENNEEPTFNIAARFIANPKHQEILFSLQAKLNQ